MNTTNDAFLNGRLRLRQPIDGYRAGADPVFLAAAVPAKAGQTVLELGCGSGTAVLCLLARVPDAQVTGIDTDPDAVTLARENLATNSRDAEIIEADVTSLPEQLRQRSFNHVMANPPFFDRRAGTTAQHPAREAGRGERAKLSTWLDTGMRRLLPNGTLTLIQRIERLPDCLKALDDRVGDIRVLPLAPRQGRDAKLFVLQAKKGTKGSFRLIAPLVLHQGLRHESDADSYTAAAAAILRDGHALPFKS